MRKANGAGRACTAEAPYLRIVTRGAESVLDHEIVAILLGDDSTAGRQRAAEILEDHNGLPGLLNGKRRDDAKHGEPTLPEIAAITAARAFVMRSQEQELQSRTHCPHPPPSAA